MSGYKNSLRVNKQRDATLRIADNQHRMSEINFFFVFAGVGNFAQAVDTLAIQAAWLSRNQAPSVSSGRLQEQSQSSQITEIQYTVTQLREAWRLIPYFLLSCYTTNQWPNQAPRIDSTGSYKQASSEMPHISSPRVSL